MQIANAPRFRPASLPNKPPAQEPAPAPVEKEEQGPIGKAIRWLDDYTKPRADTAGNFKQASYFQAAFQGGSEGFYLMGPAGIAAGGASALTGAFVQNKTGSQVAGLAAGTAVGAGLGAAVGALTGMPLFGAAMVGGLVGSFQTIRAHGESKIRDSGGNATMISAFFVPGPAKVAGGIGAAMGARMESRWAQALVGAASGAALGGALAAIGYAPVSIATATLGSALAGAAGPFIGPRFSQFFRNLAQDTGRVLDGGADARRCHSSLLGLRRPLQVLPDRIVVGKVGQLLAVDGVDGQPGLRLQDPDDAVAGHG